MKWTAPQLQSISTTGKSLMVSAAAGSGKTAVLAERCAYLVCDAPQRCDVDQLLVVTFTKAAAAEMRARIEQTLRKRMAATNDPRLGKQLFLLSRAQITTLHGFCQSVIRRHFHLLELDPNFRVLDEEEISLLKREIARALFDDRYESDTSGQFQKLIDLYGNGDDQIIVDRVLSLHDLMGSMIEPAGWLSKSARDIAEAKNAKPLAASRLGRELAGNICRWLADIRGRWINLATRVAAIDGLEPYGEYINELIAGMETLQQAFGDGNFDALSAEFAQFQKPTLPRFRNPPPEKEFYQAAIDAIRKQFQDGPLSETCSFTEQQWRDGLAAIYAPAKAFVDLARDFQLQFGKAKRELRGIDFTDLERFTLQILRANHEGSDLTPSAVAKSYQSEFKHVLVDEYQDINEVQDAILHLVSRESNLFTVGDVKQSIYRFRLAQPERFLERYRAFKGETVPPALSTAPDNASQKAGQSHVVPASSPGTPGEDRGEGSSRHARTCLPPEPSPCPSLPAAREPEYRARVLKADALPLLQSDLEPQANGIVIDLSENFRSRAPLLNVINGVFEKIMTQDAVGIEYDVSHRLKPGASYPQVAGAKTFSGSPVELHLLPPPSAVVENEESSTDQELDRTEREAALVAKRISDLMSSGTQVADKSSDGSMALRPLQYRDIVVLLRSMKYKSLQYAGIFRGAGIPVHTDSGTGFFESMEIRDMLALLRLLDNQRQDVPLAAVLRSPLSGLAEADDCLARIRLAYPDAETIPFHSAVVRYAADRDDELAAQLTHFLETLSNWRRVAHQRPLAEVLWHIYDSTGYLAFCSGMNDGEQRVANLIDFHERARQFGTFQRQGLNRFMEFLDSLAEQSELGQPSVASEADDVVRVMSIHRAKGLEFPVVFIPDLGKQHNMKDTQGSILVDRDAGIGLMVADEKLRVKYPSLAHMLVQQRIKQQSLAEEMRVLYVAMTRAREHLILVGTCDEKMPQTWKDNWSHLTGALPAETILAGRTMLDWVGPAAAAMEGCKTPDRINETWYDPQAAAALTAAVAGNHELSTERLTLANLEPLSRTPLAPPESQLVIDRLLLEYQFKNVTKLPAVQSVGALTKGERLLHSHATPLTGSTPAIEIELPAPRCVVQEQSISAADAGSATHLVLEHLDFSQPCDRDNLRSQVDRLVARKLIDSRLVNSVDLDSIIWLMSSEVGVLLRKNNDQLRREVPIYYPLVEKNAAKSKADGLDRIMVRGRIDVLIDDAEGLLIVDYKTDRVSLAGLDERAAYYTAQLSAYREVISGMLNRPVKSAWLVFLQGRAIRAV